MKHWLPGRGLPSTATHGGQLSYASPGGVLGCARQRATIWRRHDLPCGRRRECAISYSTAAARRCTACTSRRGLNPASRMLRVAGQPAGARVDFALCQSAGGIRPPVRPAGWWRCCWMSWLACRVRHWPALAARPTLATDMRRAGSSADDARTLADWAGVVGLPSARWRGGLCRKPAWALASGASACAYYCHWMPCKLGDSVTQVALAHGYDSPSAFIAAFRSAFFCTPGALLRQQDPDASARVAHKNCLWHRWRAASARQTLTRAGRQHRPAAKCLHLLLCPH